VLFEYLGHEADRHNIQIFATDLSEEAIERHGWGSTWTAVESVLSSLSPQSSQAKIKVKRSLQPEPVLIAMESPRIEQVLLNLVGNAVKISNNSSRVTVRVRCLKGHVRVEI
jgi:signal transduction histidine kinase